MRISKEEYYLDIALAVAKRSTCLRRCYGAIIVKNDEIIATGYNGAPRGSKNCTDVGSCYRMIHKIPHGSNYELCKSVHAEQNCIISAARKDMIDSTMYLSCWDPNTGTEITDESVCPCDICSRLIINAGIKNLITRNSYHQNNSNEWFRDII